MEPESDRARVVGVQSRDEVGEVYAYAAKPLIRLLNVVRIGRWSRACAMALLAPYWRHA